jgi:hypothetical protein
MSLRIACDLDGTLADMNAALQREAERIFGERVDVGARTPFTWGSAADATRERPEACDGAEARRRPLDERQRSRLWRHVRKIDGFWETLPEIEPGTVVRLAVTAATKGWEVLFLTRRPNTAGATAQVQSQRWLRANGFELPSVYVVSESRGHVAASLALDTVIDDSPENCVDVAADSRAKPVLVWRDSAERLPPGLCRLPIQVVSSMAEAIEHATRLQVGAHAPRGTLRRLHQAFRQS